MDRHGMPLMSRANQRAVIVRAPAIINRHGVSEAAPTKFRLGVALIGRKPLYYAALQQIAEMSHFPRKFTIGVDRNGQQSGEGDF
jgi:hypothetical protein